MPNLFQAIGRRQTRRERAAGITTAAGVRAPVRLDGGMERPHQRLATP